MATLSGVSCKNLVGRQLQAAKDITNQGIIQGRQFFRHHHQTHMRRDGDGDFTLQRRRATQGHWVIPSCCNCQSRRDVIAENSCLSGAQI
ncbi:Uncharacterised protein [Enterobacter cloacae]|uniref:Uncharacterized protein n=1 Tax=Enterobacter cloacae TaxID=550 RepID=A0A377M8Q6_ENTCL|nr:Uncharacterised protein [Enterobacter cloacae]